MSYLGTVIAPLSCRLGEELGNRPVLDRTSAEYTLLLRLMAGHTKLRQFPSLQWSVGGKRFIRSSWPERLQRRGLIVRDKVSGKGVVLYTPSALAVQMFASDVAAFLDRPALRNLEVARRATASPAVFLAAAQSGEGL